MNKAVIYTRVSTEDQVANFSLESQSKQCRQYAEQNNLVVDKVFVEEGASAKTVEGRPTLLKLLKYCYDKKNNISVVIVYKYDRCSRNTAED